MRERDHNLASLTYLSSSSFFPVEEITLPRTKPYLATNNFLDESENGRKKKRILRYILIDRSCSTCPRDISWLNIT